MNRQSALNKMQPPGAYKKGKWRNGVIQIWVTRTCDKSCFGCTQGSNLRSHAAKDMYISVENFEIAVKSLIGYHGVVGVFGGNPALHPEFPKLCDILAAYIPWEQRGLWCNNPFEHGKKMRETFNPAFSNLNVHLDKLAYARFLQDWPECNPVGVTEDSRHSPVHGSMLDLQTLPDPTNPKNSVPNTEDVRWHWISKCDINQHWSGMVGQFRGQPRAWFCEVAGAQAMLMQNEECEACNGSGKATPDIKGLADYLGCDYQDVLHVKPSECPSCKGTGYSYPDTGIPLPQETHWWHGTMEKYADQVDHHCHQCLVPLRGYGELACSNTGHETTTKTYLPVFTTKRAGRQVAVIDTAEQLTTGKIEISTHYLQNSKK